jgi:nitrate reductase alpha subunit
VIVGSGMNHWYHSNLHYRASIMALMLCGCIGVNGGGLNHYTGQEKVIPAASWVTLAMALDWSKPPRQVNAPSFHYVHTDQWRYEKKYADYHPPRGRFAKTHTMDLQAMAVRLGWLPFFPQFNRSPAELFQEAQRDGAKTEEEIKKWVVRQLQEKKLRFAVEDPDAPENWPRVWIIWRGNAIMASAKGHEYFLKHYLGTHTSAIAEEVARDTVQDIEWREPAPVGKLDLVVDINYRMDTSAMYSDIILPSATWYEKDDVNTTDLHTFIHPLGQAVPPCWESMNDWDIFRTLALRASELAEKHFPEPFQDIVMTPLQHDTEDELAQPEVKDWYAGECEPVPGKTMPHIKIVERDYRNLFNKYVTLGPLLRKNGVEDHGIEIPLEEQYDRYKAGSPLFGFDGKIYPSIVDVQDAINALLSFSPETNGEVSYIGFKEKEKNVGLPLADLAEGIREVRYDLMSLIKQPRRILTSPCWSGILNKGRPYAAYAMNVERLVPWRTLTGRQHFYLDHEGYIAFGESLPTFKPKIDLETSRYIEKSTPGDNELILNFLTPHGKWHMHTTYFDNLRMLTLSRGIEPLWLNDLQASEIGVKDNDWVEAYNDNGAVVTRAVVSARIPKGTCWFYHAQERTLFPKSPLRNKRGGAHNSLTRMRLKPVLMVGAYAQHSYRFNDYGPPATDRDTWVIVHKLTDRPPWD